MRPLNVPEILRRAWRLTVQQPRRWFDMAVVPLILLLALDLLLLPDPTALMTMSAGGPIDQGAATAFLGSVILYFLLSLIVWTMFASAWLQACLDVPAVPGAIPGLSWSKTDSRVLGGVIRLVLILMAGFTISVVVLGSGALGGGMNPGTAMSIGVMAFFGMSPLLARSSLILPAAAAGQNATLGESWRRSQGNALRLLLLLLGLVVGGYVASFVVGGVVAAILRGMFGTPFSVGPRLVLHLAINLASFATGAFILAALASCYRQIASGTVLRPIDDRRDGA